MTNTMKISELIMPAREDGGLDHRYITLANAIVEKAGSQTLAELKEFYDKTCQAEDTYSRAAFRFVIAAFLVKMERWERRAFRKSIHRCLQELGFKPSTVTKLIGAGEFVASEMFFSYNHYSDFMTEEVARSSHDVHIKYLREYGIGSLYQLSKMDWKGLCKAREHFSNAGKVLSTRELEKLQKRHPHVDNERRGRRSRTNRSSIEVVTNSPDENAGDPITTKYPPTPYMHNTLIGDEGLCTGNLLEELVTLANTINWSDVERNEEFIKLLGTCQQSLLYAVNLTNASLPAAFG